MRSTLFLIITSFSMIWVACGTTKPIKKVEPKDDVLGDIQSTIVFNPKTGKYDTILVRNNKIDTINWKPAPPKTKPPIQTGTKPSTNNSGNSKPNSNTSTDNASNYGKNAMPLFIKPPKGTKMKQSYNVTYLLPFFTDKFSDVDKEMYEKSLWALNFYSGSKMALDTLEQEGIRLNVNVLDTKASEAQLQLLLSDAAVQDADVLIGTETNANVKTTADFAQLNGKILISPYNPSAEIVSNNSQFVQLNPSLRTNCEAIMRHIRKNYRSDQIVLICRDKANEKEAMQYLQVENARIGNGTNLREIIIDEKVGLISIDLKSVLNQENMVFVTPIWGQNSEAFVYSLLNKINNNKGKRNITVYGMPQWASFQVNGYDSFEPLHVHITQPFYVDKIKGDSKGFSVSYFQNYGAAPTDESYMGYDLTLYTGRMLQRYGTKFNDVLDVVPFVGLQSTYNFEKEKNITNNPSSLRSDSFDRFANKAVNILKFEGGCFNKVD